jgi:Zn-dependent protease with chaperone function
VAGFGRVLGCVMITALVGCGVVPGAIKPAQNRTATLASTAATRLPIQQAVQNFAAVIARVEPLAEAECRRQAWAQNCDFQIGVDMDMASPPNAYQMLGENGRPQIIFTISLIAEARNSDELAFVLGHEAAHHIEGHLAQSEQEAINGAILGGIFASATGADRTTVERAQQFGARVGALRFSKAHELEADRLGTMIAYRAGYDPVLGAQFFSRLPDPGDGFLNSHPANAERQAIVAQTYGEISGR